MDFEALAELLGGKITKKGQNGRTNFILIEISSKRKLVFLQRDWNGKTAYWENPSKTELARLIRDPFGSFSSMPRRLV